MKKQSKSKALSEKEGIPQPAHSSPDVAKQLISRRRRSATTEELVQGILAGDQTRLSRAITLIESKAAKHQDQARQVIEACLAHTNRSVRIGITGVPGVGKSSFIEQLGLQLVGQGHKLAVLAVDPSSSLSKGSILGDKTRMEELVKQPQAFIRPSASGTSLGGVAQKTRETILLCEAAGYDVILIETVGVGQSETAVHSMTDFFLLMKLAGAGDELQGIKRGIMEMADAIVINKADSENVKAAKLAKTEFNRALHLYPQKASGWTPKAFTCSSLKNQGIEEVWDVICNYIELVRDNGYFEQKRKEQNRYWLMQTIQDSLQQRFFDHPGIKEALDEQMSLMEQNKTTPFAAANYLLQLATIS
ncbi:methylmalonyl Co-A mutase-associated GTPase MeaB [Aureitalea marina]|uniref:ATPase/protein kinase n=1 Tax=Aureitalea marina TaxID=930804 RepID=A0A2S7KMM3_9FLAO|nr:methylmalonyl Co-A mutase-associated GTPase MeaB [Aureitalea marina]PQB03848.1 ATPase/protein kinase [Aureitalea marina]